MIFTYFYILIFEHLIFIYRTAICNLYIFSHAYIKYENIIGNQLRYARLVCNINEKIQILELIN